MLRRSIFDVCLTGPLPQGQGYLSTTAPRGLVAAEVVSRRSQTIRNKINLPSTLMPSMENSTAMDPWVRGHGALGPHNLLLRETFKTCHLRSFISVSCPKRTFPYPCLSLSYLLCLYTKCSRLTLQPREQILDDSLTHLFPSEDISACAPQN